jgi:hypothetical protein
MFHGARHPDGTFDIAFLGGLVAAHQQQVDDTAVLHVIDAVTRTGVDSHLRYAFTHRLAVTEVAGFRSADSDEDASATDGIFEVAEPSVELVRAEKRVHG